MQQLIQTFSLVLLLSMNINQLYITMIIDSNNRTVCCQPIFHSHYRGVYHLNGKMCRFNSVQNVSNICFILYSIYCWESTQTLLKSQIKKQYSWTLPVLVIIIQLKHFFSKLNFVEIGQRKIYFGAKKKKKEFLFLILRCAIFHFPRNDLIWNINEKKKNIPWLCESNSHSSELFLKTVEPFWKHLSLISKQEQLCRKKPRMCMFKIHSEILSYFLYNESINRVYLERLICGRKLYQIIYQSQQ